MSKEVRGWDYLLLQERLEEHEIVRQAQVLALFVDKLSYWYMSLRGLPPTLDNEIAEAKRKGYIK